MRANVVAPQPSAAAVANDSLQTRRPRLGVLFTCLFVAMIGFGITLPVLPFYAERVALRAGASAADVAVQAGLLTAIYPLAQLVFAPLWGYWSDALGRRRLVLVGIGGAAVGQLAFAFAGTLGALYSARALGGFLSSAIFPAAAGYVADATEERERARGMAWLGTASSLGAVVGPALGAMLSRVQWHAGLSVLGILITGFALPFLTSAVLSGVAFAAAVAWLPESPSERGRKGESLRDAAPARSRPAWCATGTRYCRAVWVGALRSDVRAVRQTDVELRAD
ncbi:MAG: MFS transporter [Gemmatimonadaceae bacterium]